MCQSCLRVLSLCPKVTFIIHIDLNEFYYEEKPQAFKTHKKLQFQCYDVGGSTIDYFNAHACLYVVKQTDNLICKHA